MSDVGCALHICSLMHQRYADFTKTLFENWHRILLSTKKDEKVNTEVVPSIEGCLVTIYQLVFVGWQYWSTVTVLPVTMQLRAEERINVHKKLAPKRVVLSFSIILHR